MAIIGILFIIAGLLAFAWLCATMATYALPIMVGLCVGHWLSVIGVGLTPSVVLSIGTGFAVLVAGHLAVSASKPVWLAPVALLSFMAPAGLATFWFADGLLVAVSAPEATRLILGALAATVVLAALPGRLRLRPEGG